MVKRDGPEQLTLANNGRGVTIGTNGSSVTSTYTGSPVKSFAPKSAAFACFVVDRTALVPSVTCNITATAFDPAGTPYPKTTICKYGNLRKVEPCNFDASWTQVAKIAFDIRPMSFVGMFASALGPVRNLLGLGAVVDVAGVAMFMDDFSAPYSCISGYVNNGTGFCVVS